MARTRSVKSASRNEQIKRFATRPGWTQARIAARYGLTLARVCQIISDPHSTVVTAKPAKRGRPVGSKNKLVA